MTEVLRYAAFTEVPQGGNPAGVVLDAGDLDAAAMQAIAAEVGYSETAFLLPGPDPRDRPVRYYSPLAEVPFCGHATIATAVAHAERHGPGRLVLHTRSGPVRVDTAADDGRIVATLVSVAPRVDPVAGADVAEALAALGWTAEDLDPALPARVAYAGAAHLVLAVAARERLARLDYDFDRLGAQMAERNWTTVSSCTGAVRPRSTRATRSRPAGCTRTRPPARPPPRSAPTSRRSAPSTRRPASRSRKVWTWAGRARSWSTSPPGAPTASA